MVSPRIDRPVPETSGKLYGSGESPAGEMSRSVGASKQRVAESAAGTQALPVDTDIRKPGRPKTGFDKAAYNREFMRKKRAAEKAAREATK